MAETVKIEAGIPRKLYNAFRLIVELSDDWVNDDTFAEAMTPHITKAITNYVEGQVDSGFPIACNYLENELKAILQ